MSAMVSIYGLIDPRTNECRYVGKAKNVITRGYQHICASQLRPKTYKNHWIKELLRNGEKPAMAVFEEVPEDEWEEAESFWIEYLRFIGAKLTNATSGGDGVHNPSTETREKIGAATHGKKRVFSEEHIKKIALANKLRAKDPVWLARARENLNKCRNVNGHAWKLESRLRASAAQQQRSMRKTPEERREFAMTGVKARQKNVRRLLCDICSKEFKTIQANAMYCSGVCRQRAHRARQVGTI